MHEHYLTPRLQPGLEAATVKNTLHEIAAKIQEEKERYPSPTQKLMADIVIEFGCSIKEISEETNISSKNLFRYLTGEIKTARPSAYKKLFEFYAKKKFTEYYPIDERHPQNYADIRGV